MGIFLPLKHRYILGGFPTSPMYFAYQNTPKRLLKSLIFFKNLIILTNSTFPMKDVDGYIWRVPV